MRIVCIGAGPGGLYFATLMKKADARHDIYVVERNRPDDTFGFGVVFSDATQNNLAAADPETYASLAHEFFHWDDISIHYRGGVIRSGGHGFSGLSRRKLLQVLGDRSRELGVCYVLEGSVLKAGTKVRIVAQLVDATTAYHLWAERYDRDLQDIFALQDELTQKILVALKVKLTPAEQARFRHAPTSNLEAYDALLRGMEYYSRFTKEANAQARQLYEKALALDPQYAEAYAQLGWTYYQEWIWRWSTDPQTLERALALVQQALILDDSLPTAHSRLSQIYALQQQYDQAFAEGERAIALDPNNADSYAFQAQALNLAGRPVEALRRVEQAMRLNPRYPPFYLSQLGWAYSSTGRYAEAIATLKEAISRNPNFISAHFNLAVSYLLQWVSQQSLAAQTL